MTRLWDFIKKNVSIKSDQVADIAQHEFEIGTSLNDIPEQVLPQIALGGIESRVQVLEELDRACTEYQMSLANKIKKSAKDIIRDINDGLKIIKNDFSNLKFFGLDKAEYSNEEIRILEEFCNNIWNFHYGFDAKSKIPECTTQCEKCLLNSKKGCKMENYPTRFDKWTGDYYGYSY